MYSTNRVRAPSSGERGRAWSARLSPPSCLDFRGSPFVEAKQKASGLAPRALTMHRSSTGAGQGRAGPVGFLGSFLSCHRSDQLA